MKTELQKKLAKAAPSIAIVTLWEHDHDHHDIRKDCDGMDDENPEDWQAWQSEVKATAIHEGIKVTASVYLGGTWEKAGDNPHESNPDISGYEPQMTAEALNDLAAQLPADSDIHAEISAAIALCSAE
jgi:hypothetical protein